LSEANIPGFIGLPTALAFARAGHIVYGTTRDQKAARQLAKHEIVPLICPPNGAHGYAVWGKIAADVDVGEW
jgi:NAD(P)-dependent dehydrogenase (short-subunit alcohol dehydrogenase family)